MSDQTHGRPSRHPCRLARLGDRPWLRLVSAACAAVPGPYTLIREIPGGPELLERLVEGASLEVEFDRLGRELLWLGLWEPYASMWVDALAIASSLGLRASRAAARGVLNLWLKDAGGPPWWANTHAVKIQGGVPHG